MDKQEKLYEFADEAGICVETRSFPSSLLGIYIKEPGLPPVIGLNKEILYDAKLHTCVLAEEMGHYYTTAGDCVSPCYSFNDRVVLSKKERLAMKWAVNFLIPINELAQAFREGLSLQDMPDKLAVTQSFLDYSLMLYSKVYPYIKIADDRFLMLQGYPNVYVYRRLSKLSKYFISL